VRDERQVLEISNVLPQHAQDIFDRVGGELVSNIERTYHYTCKFDYVIKGLISLGKPIQSSMVYDAIAPVFQVLGAGTRKRFNSRIATIGDAISILAGKLIAAT